VKKRDTRRVGVMCSVDPRYCAPLPPQQQREASSGAQAIQAAGGAAYLLVCTEEAQDFWLLVVNFHAITLHLYWLRFEDALGVLGEICAAASRG
jgi:hypothetical protein